jgi:hypothetical protein
MFALDRAEIETLVRLAAATADESNRKPDGGEYDRALASFSDPAEVHRLAASTWARIEQE